MTSDSQQSGPPEPVQRDGEVPPDQPGWASLNREAGGRARPDSPTMSMGTPFPPPGSLPPASPLPPANLLPPASPLPPVSAAVGPAGTAMPPPGAGLAPGTEPGGPPGGPPPGWGTVGMDWRETRRAERAARRARRRGGASGGLIFGLILMLVGGYFLVRQAMPAIDADRAWPILSIVVGGVLVVLAFAYGDRN